MGNVVKTRRVITGGGGSGGGGGGSVNSVNSGTDITVDNTDPANPIVNFTGTYQDPITVVANYSALPAVGTVTGEFYWCSASQGTSWLPGGLGGTYYSAGLYYSNGVTWEFMDVPYQATQAEVNTGTNTNKFVTPATLASATTVISSTGTTGDLLSFSASNTPSRIADVSVGSYLRSGGVATLPLWSTAKLLNTLTANYIPYNSATDTQGQSSLLQFDGTIFTANALKSNGSGMYIGSNAATSVYISYFTSDQNTFTLHRLQNGSGGTGAAVGFQCHNGTSGANFYITGTGYTASGVDTQSGLTINGLGTGGTNIAASNASGLIRFITGGSTERARLTAVGNVKIAGTATRDTTEGTNHLDIFDGTAPVGTLANGISLYSTAGELRVMDAAGNATLLSPHEKVTNNWIYDSVDTTTGKHLKIDMELMMKAINKHFGWDFVKEFNIK